MTLILTEIPGRNNTRFELNVRVKKKAGWFFAFSEPLKVSGYSKKSIDAAEQDLLLNVVEFLDYHESKRSLNKVLKRRGYLIPINGGRDFKLGRNKKQS